MKALILTLLGTAVMAATSLSPALPRPDDRPSAPANDAGFFIGAEGRILLAARRIRPATVPSAPTSISRRLGYHRARRL